MITDALLNFVAPGASLSLVGVASTPSPLIIDLLGLGAGVSPTPEDIIGNTTLWGDPDAAGTSGFHPEINIGLGSVAFTTGGAATLNVALQGAPDAGTPTFQPGTWVTYIETGVIAIANLTANAAIKLPFHLPFPPNARPRFLRLLFQIPAANTFTAGSIASALVTTLRDDYFAKYSPNNYVAA